MTQLLERAARGDEAALDELVPLVYEELRRRASGQMRGERSNHTLGTTGLVHEALLRLRGQDRAQWENSAQFFAVASLTMRRVLRNWARDRARLKRGGGAPMVPLESVEVAAATLDPEAVLALDEALNKLQRVSPRAVRIVECRYFADLSVDETALALEVSPATVKRDWRVAKAWLRRELDGADR